MGALETFISCSTQDFLFASASLEDLPHLEHTEDNRAALVAKGSGI